ISVHCFSDLVFKELGARFPRAQNRIGRSRGSVKCRKQFFCSDFVSNLVQRQITVELPNNYSSNQCNHSGDVMDMENGLNGKQPPHDGRSTLVTVPPTSHSD